MMALASTRTRWPSTRSMRAGRHRRHRRPQDAQAVRRPDPAGALRGRAGQQPRPARARRADRGHGRRGAGATSGRRCATFAAPRQDRRLRHALPRGGRRLRRPDHPDGARPGRRRRAGHRDQGHGRAAHDPGHAARRRPRPRSARCPASPTPSSAARRVVLNCSDSDAALRAFLPAFPAARDIEVSGAGLEEAFLQLTGDDRPTSRPQTTAADDERDLHPSTSCCGCSATGGSSSSRWSSRSIMFFLLGRAEQGRPRLRRDGARIDVPPLYYMVGMAGYGAMIAVDRRRRPDRGRAARSAGTGSCG